MEEFGRFVAAIPPRDVLALLVGWAGLLLCVADAVERLLNEKFPR